MKAHAVIPARFNGPPGSGNGGYSCGVLAAHIEGCARIRLHVPPPLDTPLSVKHTADGGVAMYDADTLVGSGSSATLTLDIPTAPSVDAAAGAMSRYEGHEDHAFPTCFVCGPGRPAHDGLALYPGSVAGSALLACTWQPREDMLDKQGDVREEIVWAALDCPGYFAAMAGNLRPALLGELVGEIRADVPASEPLIVYSWALGNEGRKHWGATAIANSRGATLACARSTWIELRP